MDVPGCCAADRIYAIILIAIDTGWLRAAVTRRTVLLATPDSAWPAMPNLLCGRIIIFVALRAALPNTKS